MAYTVDTTAALFEMWGQASGNRFLGRTSNGVLWVALQDDTDAIWLRYSTNNGVTWNDPTTALPAHGSSGVQGVSVYIDNDDQLHVFYGITQGACYAILGTPNAGRTDYTWTTWQTVDNGLNGPNGARTILATDLAAIGSLDGNDAVVAYAYGGGYGNEGASGDAFARIMRWSSGTLTAITTRTTYASYGGVSAPATVCVGLQHKSGQAKETANNDFMFGGMSFRNWGMAEGEYTGTNTYVINADSSVTQSYQGGSFYTPERPANMAWNLNGFITAVRAASTSTLYLHRQNWSGIAKGITWMGWTISTDSSNSQYISVDTDTQNVWIYRVNPSNNTQIQRKRVTGINHVEGSWTLVDTLPEAINWINVPHHTQGTNLNMLCMANDRQTLYISDAKVPQSEITVIGSYTNVHSMTNSEDSKELTLPRALSAPNFDHFLDLGNGEILGITLRTDGTQGRTLLRSTDNGKSWVQIGNRSSAVEMADIAGLAVVGNDRDRIFVVGRHSNNVQAEMWSWDGANSASFVNDIESGFSTHVPSGGVFAWNDGTDDWTVHGNTSDFDSGYNVFKRTSVGSWSSLGYSLVDGNTNLLYATSMVPAHSGDGRSFSGDPDFFTIHKDTLNNLKWYWHEWNGSGWTKSSASGTVATSVLGSYLFTVADGNHVYMFTASNTMGNAAFYRLDYGRTGVTSLAVPSGFVGTISGGYPRVKMAVDNSPSRDQYIYLVGINVDGQLQTARYNKISNGWDNWAVVDEIPDVWLFFDGFNMPRVKNSRSDIMGLTLQVQGTAPYHNESILWRNLFEAGPGPSTGFGWGKIPIGA